MKRLGSTFTLVAFLFLCSSFSFLNAYEQHHLLSSGNSDHLVWVREKIDPFSRQGLGNDFHVYSKNSKLNKKVTSFHFGGTLLSSWLEGETLYILYPSSLQSYHITTKKKKVLKRIEEAKRTYVAFQKLNDGFLEISAKDNLLYVKDKEGKWQLIEGVEKFKEGTRFFSKTYRETILFVFISKEGTLSFFKTNTEFEKLSLDKIEWPEINSFALSTIAKEPVLVNLKELEAYSVNQNRADVNLPEIDSNLHYLNYAEIDNLNIKIYRDEKKIYTQIFDGVEADTTELKKDYSDESKQYLISQFAWTFFIIVSISLFISLRNKQLKEHNLNSVVTKPANVFLRCMAFSIDFIITSPVVELINYMIFGDRIQEFARNLMLRVEGNPEAMTQFVQANFSMVVTIIAVHMLVFIVYQCVLESFFQASMGKMFFHLKLVGLEGQRVTRKQIVLKGIGRFVDYFLTIPLGILFCLSNKKRQSFGDKLAKTLVVSMRF